MSEIDAKQEALLVLMVHFQTKETFSREGVVEDMKRVIAGLPPMELLNPEALLAVTQQKQECISGVMSSQHSVPKGGIH